RTRHFHAAAPGLFRCGSKRRSKGALFGLTSGKSDGTDRPNRPATQYVLRPVRREDRTLSRASPNKSCNEISVSAQALRGPVSCSEDGGPGRDRTDDLPGKPGRARALRHLETKWWTWSGSNRRPLPCHRGEKAAGDVFSSG